MMRRGLLTPDETAEHLSVSRKTVLRLADRKELPAVRLSRRLVRFRPADVDTFVRRKVAS